MKSKLLSLSLLAVAVVGPSALLAAPAAAPAAVSVTNTNRNAPDPAVEIKHLAELFRAGDLAGLAQGLTPRRQWEQARLAYEMQRNKPTGEATLRKSVVLTQRCMPGKALRRASRWASVSLVSEELTATLSAPMPISSMPAACGRALAISGSSLAIIRSTASGAVNC